ncbi:MAG TPA: lipoprotein [Gammaproteobacteria bacterium]
MKNTLYMRAALVALLMLGVAACGQKGPLVAPPAAVEKDAVPVAADDAGDIPQSIPEESNDHD